MNKLSIALLAATFAFRSAFALAAGTDQKALKPYDCRDPHSPHSELQIPIECVPLPKDSPALRDEAQRKSTGVPKDLWKKITPSEKEEAVEESKRKAMKQSPHGN